MTSWCCAAIGASARAAMRTLQRWFSAFICWPRRSSAFPPRATTSSMSVSQRRDENRLDGVHAVFRLFERDVVFGFEDVVGHFDAAAQPVGLGNLAAERRLGVVERRQAVHELHLRVSARAQEVHVDLIRTEQ